MPRADCEFCGGSGSRCYRPGTSHDEPEDGPCLCCPEITGLPDPHGMSSMEMWRAVKGIAEGSPFAHDDTTWDRWGGPADAYRRVYEGKRSAERAARVAAREAL